MWITRCGHIEFFIGIGHIAHFFDKPSITQCVGILQRQLSFFGRQDKIPGVQHIEGMELGRIYLFHISSCIGNLLKGILHLRLETSLYQFVIPTQLSGMITTHILVPIRGIVFVERADGKVQHTVVEVSIFQDVFVGFCLGKGGSLYALIYKLVVVEVTLVDLPHIKQTEQGNTTNSKLLTQLALEEKQ